MSIEERLVTLEVERCPIDGRWREDEVGVHLSGRIVILPKAVKTSRLLIGGLSISSSTTMLEHFRLRWMIPLRYHTRNEKG